MKRTDKQIVGRLEQVERLPNSRYGNPRFWIVIDGHWFKTQCDASVNYEVTNYQIGHQVMLTMTKAENVYGMEYVQ